MEIFIFFNLNLNFEFGTVWYRPKPEPVRTSLTGNRSNQTDSHRFGEPCFTSDQDLFTDGRTKPLVTKFAVDQDAFFQQFVYSYVKMGQINVLTGATQGQIRANCSARNNNEQQLPPWSVVETVVDAAESIVL